MRIVKWVYPIHLKVNYLFLLELKREDDSTCKSRPENTPGFDEAKPLNFTLQEDDNHEQIGIKLFGFQFLIPLQK